LANRQRFTRPIQGTLDGSGNGSLTISPPPSSGYWAVLTLAGNAQGTPSWTISSGGNLLQSGSGPTVVLSMHPLGPGETLDIILTNGEQNTGWSATLYGTLTDSEQDAMSLYQPSSMAASSSTAVQAPIVALRQAPSDSGIYTINDVAVHVFQFVLPSNTQGIRWKWRSSGGATFTQMHLLGNNTGVLNPYNGANFDGSVVGASTQEDQFFIVESTDTQILVTVQLAAGDVSFELDAYVSPIVVAAQLVGNIGNKDGFAIVVRTSQTATPAPWQAARLSAGNPGALVAVAGGARATLVPAVAAQRIYVFDVDLVFGAALAAPDVLLDSGAGTNVIAIVGPPGQSFFLNRAGVPSQAVNQPLQLLNNTGAGITFVHTVTYTQAAP